MPKRKAFTLSENQVAALETASKTDHRLGMVRRCTAMRLLHLGHKAPPVAEILSASEPSVYAWHERFCVGGVEDLANQPRQQPLRKVSDEYIRQLEATPLRLAI
jgi:transposase